MHNRELRRVVPAIALVALAACSSGKLTAAVPDTTAAASVSTNASATEPAATASTRAAATSTTVIASPRAASGITSVTVDSTTAQYFVLYVKPDLNTPTEIPVAIVRGKAGTTTLTDGRSQLAKEHYRVATFSVDKPGDVDGDKIDDLTELADPVNLNPLNPAPKLDPRQGAVIISDVATFEKMSYQGNDVGRDSYLAGLEFMKFWITGANTDHPAVYFMNTNNFNAHPTFAREVGIPAGAGPAPGFMRGDIVFTPTAVAPDGSKGTYRFAFQPNDAYPFKEIALAYELLAANMPMLKNNLLYYPFPQSALPLYQKEKVLYEAYRVPVLLA